MMKFSADSLPKVFRDSAGLVTAAFLIPGFLSGIWICGSAGAPFFSAMRTAAGSPISLVGSLSSAVLPFLFSAFAVYMRQSVFLIPIAFVKALLFSYSGCGLCLAWGSAGWLMAGLMMFSSLMAMPVLCWYWVRHLRGRDFEFPQFCVILGYLLTIGILDYCLISPFLARIITF